MTRLLIQAFTEEGLLYPAIQEAMQVEAVETVEVLRKAGAKA